MALVVVVLCGCGKTNEKVGKNVDTENIKIPKYKKVILTDLENCNINFIKTRLKDDLTIIPWEEVK